MFRKIAAGGLLLIAVACSSAGETATEHVRPVHPHEARAPIPPLPDPVSTSPVPPAHRSSWLARFSGCEAPVSACHCNDRVLAVPHQELRRGPTPKPISGFLVIANIDLHPLQLRYFAPIQLNPAGFCLSGPCPKEGPVRFELVGPGEQTSSRYGTWNCGGGRCQGPVETWSSLQSNAWLDVTPDHEALRLFVKDRLVYSASRSKLPMGARVVLLSEPEYALALSFGDGEPEGAFVGIDVQTPSVDVLGTSLKVRRRAEGCWSLIELGDLPFVDPLSVGLSDGFRSEIYRLPVQDGVPRAARPKASHEELAAMKSTRPARFAHAQLARHTFDPWQPLRAADFSFADLRKAYFRGVDARGAHLHKARLQQAYLYQSDFAGADFSDADLRSAYLIRVKLRDTNFHSANLARMRLDRSDLGGANLAHARNLTQAQLDSACGDTDTKLPPGLSIRTCWESWMSLRTNAIVDPGATELLVATRSRDCAEEPCLEPCCDSCRRIEWKPNADRNVQIVPEGIALPDYVENMCGLHYDLRAEGKRDDDRLLVRSVQPVPSERARRAGTPGQLELEAVLGSCTTMGCSPHNPCCNNCSFEGWRPKPTLDLVKWSGEALPYPDTRGCGGEFALAVTGSWLGPSEFEVNSVHKVK